MYWFELSPDTVNLGLGFWGMNRPALDAMRRLITQTPSKMLDVLQQARIPDESYSIDGDIYKRMKVPDTVPQALVPFYPRKELYLCKRGFTLADAYSQRIAEQCGQEYLRLKPLYLLFRELADIGKATLDA